MPRLALFSPDTPSHALGSARLLAEAGFSIVCSRETFDILQTEGLPCIDVAKYGRLLLPLQPPPQDRGSVDH